MKKLLQTTWIALLISTVVFAQKGTTPGKQVAPSQTTVLVAALTGNIILLSPAEGKIFGTGDASKPVLFRWTAVSPKPKDAVTYRLRVWQLMQGQNGTEAMRTNQPVVTKEVTNITQTAIGNLYTGPCKPPYMCDFVWAVEAFMGDDIATGKPYGASENYSFKFNADGQNSKDKESDNSQTTKAADKRIDKSTPTVKSTDGQGEPVHGVDVKLSVKGTNEVYQGAPINCEFSGHPDKIIFDADCNIIGMVVKTGMPNRISMGGKAKVILDEATIWEMSKETSPKSSYEAVIQNLRKDLESEAISPKIGPQFLCPVIVYCNNPNHGVGCGWIELRPCKGNWNIDR